jgi:cytochrome c6
MMRILCIPLLLAMLVLACGNNGPDHAAAASGDAPRSRGEMIYTTHCTLCHGEDGRLGIGGARDLSVSQLGREEMKAIVANGKGGMMAYRNVLSAKEIDAVVDHVRTLGRTE